MNNLKWYAHILAHIQLKWRERQRMSHIFVASLWRAVLSCLLSMPCAVYSLCAICALHFEYHFFDFFGCCLHSNSYRRRKALTFHQYRPLCWCTVQIYLYFCVFFLCLCYFFLSTLLNIYWMYTYHEPGMRTGLAESNIQIQTLQTFFLAFFILLFIMIFMKY